MAQRSRGDVRGVFFFRSETTQFCASRVVRLATPDGQSAGPDECLQSAQSRPCARIPQRQKLFRHRSFRRGYRELGRNPARLSRAYSRVPMQTSRSKARFRASLPASTCPRRPMHSEPKPLQIADQPYVSTRRTLFQGDEWRRRNGSHRNFSSKSPRAFIAIRV